ncbi:MAG: PTS sugar transporter subunit IIA [bacterium]|nr:PTS sugar transporter subunit IIA [bacterium]
MNLTVVDVTRLFSVSEKTVHRWIKSLDLPAYRVNGRYHFNRTELLEWAAARRVTLAPGPEGSPGAGASSLADAIEAGGIHYDVGGEDKAAVLADVVERLRLPAGIERARLLEVLLAREAMGSTAVGEGIAIPHPRNPIVLGGHGPSITLCFLTHPIDFAALDGRSVDILFTLISPTVPAHLGLLSRLMFVLREPLFKKILLHRGSPEEILLGVRHAEGKLTASANAPPNATAAMA